jgi:hypothetical protein
MGQRRNLLRRVVFITVALAAMAVAATASAHHLASGATKRAILKAVTAPGPVNTGHNCHTRALPCWRVVISGNSWATADDVGPGNDGAGEWLYIEHLIHGHWRYVGGEGEGILFRCRKAGMPPNIARDLRIVCA